MAIEICTPCRGEKHLDCVMTVEENEAHCDCSHGVMSEDEHLMAKEIYEALNAHSRNSGRSQHAAQFKLGISDIGYCPERLRRTLDQQVPADTDLLPAFIGTAIGKEAEEAIKAELWPDAILQAEVVLRLRVQGRVFSLPGHPDIIRPGWGVIDGKTDFGLSAIEREGPSFSQQFQRHAYGLAAFEAGYFPEMSLEDVMVGNFWIDRGGQEKRVHVQFEKFDQSIIDRGVEELDSIIYAYLNGEEAEKRPPREVCRVTCGHFAKCREWETDVSGLIDDPEYVAAILAYVEGRTLETRGRKLKAEAKAKLDGVSGSTGEWLLRQTWTNPTEVPASSRKGHYRIDIKPVRKT